MGWHIVEAARNLDYDVVSLSRGTAAHSHAYPVANVAIDLLRPAGLAAALAGVDAVVHAAGIMREDDTQNFERAHVGATANLVDACREAGVEKIIHISALGARIDSPIPYLQTKWQAEDVIEGSGIAYTVFRPSLIFGRNDRLVSHLVSLLRYSPLVPVIGPDDLEVQPVWVGDVATAVVRAIEDRSSDGRVYQLGGPRAMSFEQIVQTVREAIGSRSLSVRVPSFITGPFLRLGEQLFNEPPMTTEQMSLLAAGGTCDPDPAAVTFGLRMRSLGDSLTDYIPRD